MNILETIKAYKLIEVAERKQKFPIENFVSSTHYEHKCYSLKESILRGTGIIAEFKRKSPSKGIINDKVTVEEVTVGYTNAGASGLSVLTDTEFFGGSTADLQIARRFNAIPILRKDFIVDTYQIHEAKAMGADVILLIAAMISPEQIQEFTKVAHFLGMEVLLEVHDRQELTENLPSEVDIIGVNNRSLKTFEVDLQTSAILSELIPKNIIKISESGIATTADMNWLKSFGYKGFLIGESFMKDAKPHEKLQSFLNAI
jgi:indole-3-glycerol phosphate synthase